MIIKKIKIDDILFINITVVLLIIVIAFFPSNILRAIIGIPFLLFFPGYTLIAALFPKKEDLSGLERIALSLGLSVAVVIFTGLLLNYSPWGITLYPILFSLSFFILITSAIACYRRFRLPAREYFILSLQIGIPRWAGLNNIDKALIFFLILSILAVIGAFSYTIITPKAGERFTEFYVLGPGGKAENYPHELTLGEDATVILGIINHEGQQMRYNIKMRIGRIKKEIGQFVLANGQKWENRITFTPKEVGKNQKVSFLLYKNGESKPSETLYLFINVIKK